MYHRLFFYKILIACLLPFFILADLRRGAGRRELAMRFGFYKKSVKNSVGTGEYALWLHAASMGEANAALTLLAGLCPADKKTTPRILISLGTQSAYRHVVARADSNCDVILLPYELTGAIRRLLKRMSVPALVIVENDFWPLLLHLVARKGVRIFAVSSSLSESSVHSRRLAAAFSYPFWRDLHSIAAQTPQDARRFMRLGADPSRIVVCGNLKFDLTPPLNCRTQGKKLRRQIGERRPVWIAASIHPPEVAPLLDAHKRLLAERPDSLLIIAPRHMRRVASVAKTIERKGFSYSLLSSLTKDANPQLPDCRVLLADTTGKLLSLYAASDLAFVGGSLIARGGHNPIEPAILGRPILMGPHAGKSSLAANLLQQKGALTRIEGPDEIPSALIHLMTDAEVNLQQLGQIAQEAIRSKQGVHHHIKDLLGPACQF